MKSITAIQALKTFLSCPILIGAELRLLFSEQYLWEIKSFLMKLSVKRKNTILKTGKSRSVTLSMIPTSSRVMLRSCAPRAMCARTKEAKSIISVRSSAVISIRNICPVSSLPLAESITKCNILPQEEMSLFAERQITSPVVRHTDRFVNILFILLSRMKESAHADL